jgi:hypothetical protein
MKQLALLSAVILVLVANVLSQDLNQKVIQFVDANMDKKVGDGICATLVIKALEQAKGQELGLKRIKLFERFYRYDWGKRISYKDVKPGDVVLYKHKNHIGIVYDVKEDIIITAEQNVLAPRESTKKHSKVILREYEFDNKKVLKEYFVFYRPN